jgi:hypothetical protein
VALAEGGLETAVAVLVLLGKGGRGSGVTFAVFELEVRVTLLTTVFAEGEALVLGVRGIGFSREGELGTGLGSWLRGGRVRVSTVGAVASGLA